MRIRKGNQNRKKPERRRLRREREWLRVYGTKRPSLTLMMMHYRAQFQKLYELERRAYERAEAMRQAISDWACGRGPKPAWLDGLYVGRQLIDDDGITYELVQR